MHRSRGWSLALIRGCRFNLSDRLGGDSSLTPRGVDYSQHLADWVMSQHGESGRPLIVWTSTLKRTIETAQYIPTSKVHLRALDEIDAGDFDGWTYQEIEQKFRARGLASIHLTLRAEHQRSSDCARTTR